MRGITDVDALKRQGTLTVGFSSALFFACLAAPSLAQSFDCARASSPVETAICASTELRAADEALARAFASAVSGLDADSAVRLRSEQRAWLGERNACASQAGAVVGECLARAYRTRSAALVAPAVPRAVEPLPPGPPAGVASLAKTSVPASGENSTLLNVAQPGRFTIRAASRTGVALQLVDMIAGPGETAGDAGTKDGRLDVLLDKGDYKLRTFGAKVTAGDATLSVTPFAPIGPADNALLRGGERSGTLADGQQASFWIFVGANKRLSFDAAGRSLRDLRAWRNGTELSELMPDASSVEPAAGHSLTRLRLEGPVESGLYLVTAYGGESLAWSDDDTAQPFHASSGAAKFLPGGSATAVIGPSGTMRFALPGSANVTRIETPEISPLRLTLRRDGKIVGDAALQKASREPVVTTNFASGEGTIAEISGRAGQRVSLRAMASSSSARTDTFGPHVASVDLAGDGGDEVPATALLARFDRGAKGQVVSSTALRVAPGQAWRRKFNLRGPTTLLVEVAGSGPVAARVAGPGVRVTLEPLLGTNAPRADGKRPRQWDVEAGFYTLKLDPVGGAVGVLDLTFGQPDLAVEPTPAAPHRDTIDFGLLNNERGTSHQIFVNSAPKLLTAPRLRALPANLAAGALVIPQAVKVAATETPVTTPPASQVAPPLIPQPTPRPRTDAPGTPITPKPVTTTRLGPNGAPVPGSAQAKPQVASKPAAVAPLQPKPAPVLPTTAVAADRSLTLPVRTPPGGTIAVTDLSGRAVAFTRTPDAIERSVRSTTLTIPATDAARTLVVAWTAAVANEPIPALPREGEGAKIVAGTPFFFDLAKDERKSFALDVAEGGLYRVETLGRLQTSAAIATRFLPKLDEAEDNGPGHNALIQTFLRGGIYRVRVEARESAGRLGIVARPSKLIDGGTIVADGSARATLSDGAGASFALDIAETGDYRLDLYGLDRDWTARLEDSEGWPLAAPGEMMTQRRRFEKGRYRLVVMPPDVEAQIVVRLRRAIEDKPLEGHGPHALPFEKTVKAQWREPAKDAPRVPDRYEFTLAGAAKVTLETSDGMSGDLLRIGDDKPVARIAKDKAFEGELAVGRYAVEMRATGRDDRLDYTLELSSEEIQPGSPRFVDLPATIPFVVEQDRVVGLTTFGDTQLSAVLRNETGEAIERLSGRADDWNIALSRRLPAGRYSLDLTALETPKRSADDASESSDNAESKDGDAPKDRASDDAPDGDDASIAMGDGDADDRTKVEVRLALPASVAPRDLTLSGTTTAGGADVSRYAIASPDAGSLLLIAAQADAEIVLSLERRGKVVGFSRGRAPVIAVPIDAATRDGWEVAIWPVDGGNTSATLGARAVSTTASNGASVALALAGSDGPLGNWRVGRLATPGQAIVTLPARTAGLLAGSMVGRTLASLETGPVAPQADAVWFVAPARSNAAVSAEPMKADARSIALTLAAGEVATLPAGPADRLRVWRADATDGQPGFLSERGAVAQGTAFALTGDAPTRLGNAGGDGDLAVRATAIDVTRAAAIDAGAAKTLVVPPMTAQPLHLASGNKRISLQLAPGVAAALSGGDATLAMWNGDTATAREATGAWTEALLVNTSDVAAPAGLDLVPTSAQSTLAAGGVTKRYYGAAGAVTLSVDAQAGDRLNVAGSAATFVTSDGRVLRGTSIALPSPGSLTLDHPAGLVVAGLSRGDVTPWSAPKPIAPALPASVKLEGASMALALRADTPMLVRVRTTAPVVFALRQAGAGDPEAKPLGADVRRYVAAGDAELRVFSPHDGSLTGTLDVSAEPITPVGDGIGEAQVLAPGASALFAFEVSRAGMVGVGLRAEPDRVLARLLDVNGVALGEGVAQMRKLEKGRYLLEARAPADGTAVTVRPAIVGLKPRPSGPPADVAAKYFELVGMTKVQR